MCTTVYPSTARRPASTTAVALVRTLVALRSPEAVAASHGERLGWVRSGCLAARGGPRQPSGSAAPRGAEVTLQVGQRRYPSRREADGESVVVALGEPCL